MSKAPRTRETACRSRPRKPQPAMAGIGICLLLTGCGEALVEVAACVETEPVASTGDAADDPAIWINEAMPEHSRILATDKRAGIHVYSLSGEEKQFLPVGEVNNVGLRPDYPFADTRAPIVALSNHSDQTITLMRLDESLRQLVPEPVGAIATGFERVSGVCSHRSVDGEFHVGATSTAGQFAQWRLETEANGTLSGTLARSFALSSVAEGCVFDDALQRLYLAEENVGIWRLDAVPGEAGESTPTLVERTWPLGRLRSHVEGLAIHPEGDAAGYLLASSQGDSTFRVFERGGENTYVGGFRVVGCADESVDGVSHTDGIEVTSVHLGPQWRTGLLVVQDDRNRAPRANQNFKLIAWDEVARALGL